MQHGDSGTSVVVGVDGSPSSVHAAEWAIDEAVSRDVPLRLIHVIQSTSADVGREREEGELALQAAHSAITRHGRKVKVETEIMRGHVAATLVAESVGAAMICLGSAGSDLEAAKFAGTTATAVARAALTSVAIVRRRNDTKKPPDGNVAIVVDDPMDLATVVDAGLAEAALRHAGLVVLNLTSARLRELAPEDVDRRLAEALGRHPELSVRILMAPDDVATVLATPDEPVQLTVVGNAGGLAAEGLVGPYGRFVLRGTECSVLLVHRHA